MSRKILIVEDEEKIARFVELELGHEPATSSSRTKRSTKLSHAPKENPYSNVWFPTPVLV